MQCLDVVTLSDRRFAHADEQGLLAAPRQKIAYITISKKEYIEIDVNQRQNIYGDINVKNQCQKATRKKGSIFFATSQSIADYIINMQINTVL